MANTYIKIATVTVGAGGASSIDFTSIPSTFTDLLLKVSARSNRSGANGDSILFSVNGSNAGSDRVLNGNGSTASSYSDTSQMYAGVIPASTATANTFGNTEIYIPNYAGNTNKSYSVDSVNEDNATTAAMQLLAGLRSNTAAITSITVAPSAGTAFVQYSTATLYGISKS